MIKLLLILLLITSCATQKVRHEMDVIGDAGTDQNTLNIDEKKSYTYGPEVEITTEKSQVKEPVVSLVHHPTMYHSQAVIGLLKGLERENIKISIISSYGFGSLIAALYAKKKSTSYVEWKFFSLLKQLKSKKMYSKAWTEHLNQFIDKEFANVKANQLELLLVIPQNQNGELVLNFDGQVSELLKESISIQSKTNVLKNPETYSNILKDKLSSDINIKLAFLPATPVVSELEPFPYGVYTSYLGKILLDKEMFGVISTPQKMDIDQISQVTELNEAYSKEIELYTQSIIEKIQQWKQDHSSLNN